MKTLKEYNEALVKGNSTGVTTKYVEPYNKKIDITNLKAGDYFAIVWEPSDDGKYSYNGKKYDSREAGVFYNYIDAETCSCYCVSCPWDNEVIVCDELDLYISNHGTGNTKFSLTSQDKEFLKVVPVTKEEYKKLKPVYDKIIKELS